MIGVILRSLDQFIGAAERKARTENASNVARAEPVIAEILTTMGGVLEALTTLGVEEMPA